MKNLVLLLIIMIFPLQAMEIDTSDIEQIESHSFRQLAEKNPSILNIKQSILGNVLDLARLSLTSLEGIDELEFIIAGERKFLRDIPDLYIKANENKLATIPNSIMLENIVQLNLSYNQLIALPESFDRLKSLKELNLSHNRLTELPESMGTLENLKSLDLSYNQLVRLPETFENLNLYYFDLKHNPESFDTKYWTAFVQSKKLPREFPVGDRYAPIPRWYHVIWEPPRINSEQYFFDFDAKGILERMAKNNS